MSVVISVENVSKLYRLGEIGTGSIAHDLNRWWHRARGKEDPYLKIGQSNDRASKGSSDYVYALKDVSFGVKQGEVLGIIGRNGAGKSTLLKILSRVTTPTTGEIKAKGRIASLLEVGTGFHPELSGRDNIFLNGAILGMRKHEIERKFEEIVEFSGCGRYIDTPVKRYSSGMYVRLAFAVAAHLESEILIVDEVLAVGDAEFQKKCLGKMKNVAGEGRTVLFVSHNMAAVTELTSRSLLLANGQICHNGTTEDCVNQYLSNGGSTSITYERLEIYNASPCILSAKVMTYPSGTIHTSGEDLSLIFEIAKGNSSILNFSFNIVNQFQQKVVHCWHFNLNADGDKIILKFKLPNLNLNIGSYSITTWLTGPPGAEIFECLEYICNFDVVILRDRTLFGWRPEACAYIQDFTVESI